MEFRGLTCFIRVFGSGKGIVILFRVLLFGWNTDFGIMEDNLKLHLNSSHQQASDRAHSTILGGSMEIEEESGAGNIQVNSHNEVEDVEGYLN